MERIWYVFVQGQHLGPYAKDDIVDQYNKGNVNELSYLWKEGLNDWSYLRDIDEFQYLLAKDRPSELPPLPKVDLPDFPQAPERLEPLAEQSLEETSQQNLEDAETDQDITQVTQEYDLKDFPGKEISDEISLRQEVEAKSEEDVLAQTVYVEMDSVADEDEQIGETTGLIDLWKVGAEKTGQWVLKASDQLSKSQIPKKVLGDVNQLVWVRFLTITFGIFLLLASVAIIGNAGQKKLPYKQITVAQVEKLKHVQYMSSSARPTIVIVPAKEYKGLWLGTNLEKSGTLYLDLESVNGNVLSPHKVKARARAKLIGKRAYFDELEIYHGTEWEAGEYHYQLGIIFDQDSNEDVEKKFDLELKGQFLNFLGTKKQFQSHLNKFVRLERARKLIPLEEKLENVKTLKALLEGISQSYFDVLKKLRRGKEIKKFERAYAKNQAPLLQSIILDIAEKNELGSQDYTDIIELGKNIGGLVSDLVTVTRVETRIGPKTRKKLNKLFRPQMANLEDKAKNLADQYRAMIEEVKDLWDRPSNQEPQGDG